MFYGRKFSGSVWRLEGDKKWERTFSIFRIIPWSKRHIGIKLRTDNVIHHWKNNALDSQKKKRFYIFQSFFLPNTWPRFFYQLFELNLFGTLVYSLKTLKCTFKGGHWETQKILFWPQTQKTLRKMLKWSFWLPNG